MEAVLALDLGGQLEKIGAYAGFLTIPGLAVLALLYFAQARELRRLREWAGRSPERTSDAQERAEQAALQAQSRRVVAQPVARATPPVAPAAAAVKPAPGAAGASAPATPGAVPPAGTNPIAPVAVPGVAKPPAQATGAPVAPKPPVSTAQTAAATPGPGAPAAASGASAKPGAQPQPQVTQAPATQVLKPDNAEQGGSAASPPAASPPTAPQRPAQPLRVQPSSATMPPRPPAPSAVRRREELATPPSQRGKIALIGAGGAAVLVLLAVAVTQLTGGSDSPKTAATVPATSTATDTVSTTNVTPGAPLQRNNTVVSVLNGTTVPGLAAQIADTLTRVGFKRGSVTNASDQQVSKTAVQYAQGARAAALAVAKAINVPTVAPLDTNTQAIAGATASVVVIVGTDRTQ